MTAVRYLTFEEFNSVKQLKPLKLYCFLECIKTLSVQINTAVDNLRRRILYVLFPGYGGLHANSEPG